MTAVGFVAVSISVSMFAFATDEIRTQPPSRDHEQCANKCQMTLNKASSECLKLSDEAAPEKLENCLIAADEEYLRCLHFCPVNTGRRR